MEYTFKNSAAEKEKRIFLHHTGIDLYHDGAKYTVPYSNINSIWLNKPGGLLNLGEFSCTININDQKPIYIADKNYDAYGFIKHQPNNYNSFIRVLHHHLQDKSNVKYKFGSKPLQYVLRLIIITAIVFTCFLPYGFLDVNQYTLIIPILVAFTVGAFSLKFLLNEYPKCYMPDSIPLNLLPSPS